MVYFSLRCSFFCEASFDLRSFTSIWRVLIFSSWDDISILSVLICSSSVVMVTSSVEFCCVFIYFSRAIIFKLDDEFYRFTSFNCISSIWFNSCNSLICSLLSLFADFYFSWLGCFYFSFLISSSFSWTILSILLYSISKFSSFFYKFNDSSSAHKTDWLSWLFWASTTESLSLMRAFRFMISLFFSSNYFFVSKSIFTLFLTYSLTFFNSFSKCTFNWDSSFSFDLPSNNSFYSYSLIFSYFSFLFFWFRRSLSFSWSNSICVFWSSRSISNFLTFSSNCLS